MGILGLLSIVQVRRRLYELFLRTHSLSAIALLVLLWLHVGIVDKYLLYCLSISVSIYVLQKGSWLYYFIYRNLGIGSSAKASITRFPQSNPAGEVFQISIEPKRPWKVTPGQFIYLSLPRLRSLGLGLLESHPFMIAWTEERQDGKAEEITLLVQVRRGFTRRLQIASSRTPALIDGPYGGGELNTLANYDKILLMSKWHWYLGASVHS